MTLDTSLYKLTRNAYAILSGAYAKLPEIAISAINVPNTPKQPRLYNQLIQVSTLFRQINTHMVYNDDNSAIIGIQGENVNTINDLLYCLRDVAELIGSASFPTPFTNYDFRQVQYIPILPGPLGSIMVSDGNAWQILEMGADGSVLTATPTGLVYSSAVGNGIPSGGTAGQFLIKNTNTSYDVIWSSLTLSQITDIDETPEELNVLDGVDTVNIGADQINTLIGINTSLTIQEQLDSKFGGTLPNGQFWVGDALDVAVPHTPTGDVTFDNTGLFAITPDVIVDADINNAAGITRSKLAVGSSYKLVINNASGVMAEAASIFPNRALISDANGIPTHSATTAVALGYISTLTGDAQDQLNNKLTVVVSGVAQGDMLTYNGTNWVNFPIGANGEVLTSDGTSVSWGSATANGIPVGGTSEQVLRKIDATNYNTEWHTLVMADISDVNTTAAELNLLSGLTVNSTQLNYTNDVTDDIQQQLNTKLSTSLSHHSIFVGGPSDTAIQYGPGPELSILTIVSGHPVWQTPPSAGLVSGPVSTTDNAVTRWSGTGGTTLKDSVVIMDDTGNITGVASMSSGQIDILNQAELRLHETGSTNYVGIRATGVMGGNYTITLPAAAPASNTSLTYDGANYVWGPSGGVTDFLSLTDVAATTYTGEALKLVRVNAGETGLEFVTPSGTGTVTSVSGTTNRITITGTPTVNPTVDIASTYVGQNTITTVGTITTGVWNGTDVALGAGGTGATLSAPVADRIFFYDFSATSSAFLEVGSGLTITGTILTATGSYNDEQAQDAIGTILTDSSTIDFTYNDATPTITAIVINNSIDDTKIRTGSALSLIGRSVNSSGNVSDISASTDGFVMRRSASTIGFGTITATSSLTMSTNRILGRTTAATGAVEELTVTNGLTLASTNLRLGGTMTQNTSFTGAGFSLTGSGFGAIQLSGTEVFLGTPIGSSIWVQNAVLQHLILGAASGAELHLGGDATGDIYYRNGAGKFVQLPIGVAGQTLITSTGGVPSWSNIITKNVDDPTYDFIDEDNGKLLIFTHASGCVATIPTGTLQSQWQVLCYRLGGTVTFTSAGSMEGVGTTMPVLETMAAIVHRDTDIFVLSGSVSIIGSGTVTSVALNNISGFATSSGGPITATGAFTLTLNNQTANYGFFGPAVSGSATPTFRAMVLQDLPDDDWDEIPTLTYSLLEDDNKLVKYVTNAGGCIITLPSGGVLPIGYAVSIYRMPGAGAVSFVSDGTSVLEGISFIMSVEETLAIVAVRDTDTFVVAGAVGVSSGGATLFTDLTDVPSSYATHALKLVRVNAAATGLEFVTAGGGSVTSVTGTAARITSTGGATPVIDIDTGYVGQASITTLGTITTGVWTGSSISTTYTQAKVASITGTASRISIGGTATVPVVNIDTAYVGQNTITTLGTITTGVWNGTAISTTYGGTGLTSIGGANTVLGVNTGATGLEYKTISLGTTAQSNNLGWVLTTPNQIVLHVPDASGTVRGVITTGTQTIAGAKTFSNNLLVGSTTNGVGLSSSSGVLTLYQSGGGANIGFSTTNNFLYSTLRWQLPQITFTSSGNTTDTSASILAAAGNATSVHTNRFFNNVSGVGFAFTVGTSAYGTGQTYTMVSISNSVSPYILASGVSSFKSLHITPSFNTTAGSTVTTAYGVYYNPTETGMAGVTHYGFVSSSTTALNGFGTATPTALIHIGAATTVRSSLRIESGTAPTTGIQNGDIWHENNHLYARLNGVTYQLDQQAGSLTDGDKGDITVSSSGATWTIDNDVVTYAKMQNVSATSRIMGRITASAGDMEELTGTQATTLLDLFSTSSTTKGLVPGSNSVGATFFLNATGAWSVPAGGGGSPGGSNTHVQFNNSGAFGGNSGLTYAESPSGTFGLSIGVASTTNIGKITLGGATGSGNITANADLSINLAPTTNGFRIIMSGTNRFQLNNNGAALFNSSAGTSGQILTSAGTGASPTWTTWNTAANTELTQSDGTNLIPSGIFISGSGSFNMGTGLGGTTRSFAATGTGSDLDLIGYPKGSGNFELGVTTGSVIVGAQFTTGNRTMAVGSSSTNAGLTIDSKGTEGIYLNKRTSGFVQIGDDTSTTTSALYITASFDNDSVKFTGRAGISGAIHGSDIHIVGGNSFTGGKGGSICLQGGSGDSSLGSGNVVLHKVTDVSDDYKGAERVLIIPNMTTAPSASIPSHIALYSQNSGDGTSTLALYLEQAAESSVVFVQTHRLKVRINGTEYWLSLDAV